MRVNFTYWSKKYKSCLECGTTERQYGGLGYCRTCYGRLRRKNGKKSKGKPETIKERARRAKDRKRYGGHRQEYLKNNPVCMNCDTNEKLVVHHGNGKIDNNPKTFETLCRSCHSRLHKFLKLKEKLNGYLSKSFILYFGEKITREVAK